MTQIDTSTEAVEALLAERDALKAEVERLKAKAVAVKPLVWVQKDDGSLVAENTIFGDYTVYLDDGFGWLIIRDGHDDSFVKYPSGEEGFETAQEAIHWVNGYYETRIRSAITTRSEDEIWNEAIEAAANQIQNTVNEGKKEHRGRLDHIDIRVLSLMDSIVSAIHALKLQPKGDSHE